MRLLSVRTTIRHVREVSLWILVPSDETTDEFNMTTRIEVYFCAGELSTDAFHKDVTSDSKSVMSHMTIRSKFTTLDQQAAERSNGERDRITR